MIAQGDASRFGKHPENDDRPLTIDIIIHPFSSFQWYASRCQSGKVVVVFADGHVDSETIRQLLYPSLENWTRYNHDNKKH